MMMAPSDTLLRTLASVSTDNRILDLECGDGRHTLPLAVLGFDVYACDHSEAHVEETRRRIEEDGVVDVDADHVSVAQPHALGYPDDFFGWVVAFTLLHRHTSDDQVQDALAEVRRVLEPGGWIYVAAPALDDDASPREEPASFASDSGVEASFTPDTLNAVFEEAGLAVAAEPERQQEEGEVLLHAVYRRVEPDTAA